MTREITKPTAHAGPGCRGYPGQRLSHLPRGEDSAFQNLAGRVVYLAGDSDRVLDVVFRGAGGLRAGILEAVARAPEPAERAKRPDAGSELGDDSVLYRDVTAAAGRPESLGFEQASRALAQRVVGQLVGTRQVSRRVSGRRGGQVPPSVRRASSLSGGTWPSSPAFRSSRMRSLPVSQLIALLPHRIGEPAGAW